MKSIISLLQFTTILPLGKPEDFERFARRSYLYPLAGYVIAGLVALPVFFIENPGIAAAVSVAGLLILTGAHHFDGLLDLAQSLKDFDLIGMFFLKQISIGGYNHKFVANIMSRQAAYNIQLFINQHQLIHSAIQSFFSFLAFSDILSKAHQTG